MPDHRASPVFWRGTRLPGDTMLWHAVEEFVRIEPSAIELAFAA